MDETVVRPLRAADRAQWAVLWRGYLDYYETKLPDAQYELTFQRMLGDDPQEYSGLVAVADGRLVGLVHYLFHRHGWKAENVCYLQDLYTDPNLRGRGVGAALIHAVYAAADAANSPDVYWNTQHFNAAGRRLYDRVGTLTPFIKYARPHP
ncbi:MAG: GNAT family N-acetyltransferase [Rhodobacteraceae bacterium]|nr:GNAT family N-acetyltransferase [Paracoccaceae bacterium]